MITMPELLSVEDDDSLLEFRCESSGIPLWPGIRNIFLRSMMADLVFGSNLVETRRGRNFRSGPLRALTSVGKAAAHNAVRRNALRGELLVTTSGAGLILKDGLWFNRLSDYFALSMPDRTVALEDLFKWQWQFPRRNERVLFRTPVALGIYATGRCSVRAHHRRISSDLVRLVRQRAKAQLGWELGHRRERFLVGVLSRFAAGIPVAQRMYRKLLTQVGAKVLLKEMGCYGSSAVFNATARDMGVGTAEYQHGVISQGHDAYNLAPALARSEEYKKTLPQYLLSYGKWWGSQVNVPVEEVVIGNPHRSETVSGRVRAVADNCDILILGDGLRTDFYLTFACALLRRLGGRRYRVVFRPHPLERETLREFRNCQCAIDLRSDIYESFSSAHVVVSEVSSGLFEAVGLVERIFVFDTPRSRFSLPAHPFASFVDAEDLVEKLNDNSAGAVGNAESSQIWAPGWETNYHSFVARYVSG